jgi:hypothetical protein
MTKRAAIPILAVLVTWASHGVPAPAGNPLQTNDPETPGPNGWEINVSQNLRFARPAFGQALPLVNINYGWLENDQWKISVPALEIDPHPGAAQWGIGDVQLGWKYRFLEEDEHGVQAAVYPQPLLPTGREDLGLGNGRVELFLPVSVGKYFFDDRLFLYAEAGHNVVFEDLHRDAWFLGAAAEWQVTEKIELVGELADLVVPQFVGSDDLFFNLGFNYQLTPHVALQTAFGRSLGDAADGLPYFNSYIGLHITWGGGKSDEGGDADECCDRPLSRWTRALLVR